MIELLQKLIYGHAHKWVQVREVEVHSAGFAVGTNYHMKCEVCGRMKQYKFRGW